jgi:hypothetical protein
MIRRLPIFVLALLAFLIIPVTLWHGFTVPRAQAQDCADDGLPPDPPTVDSVQPNNILNTSATTITVFGTNAERGYTSQNTQPA